jgi:hypothetical protein
MLNKLKCWWFGHKWRLLNFQNYIDVSYGGEATSHTYNLLCVRCLKQVRRLEYGGDHIDGSILEKAIQEQSDRIQ